MKFTLSWLKQHLDTDATVAEVAAAMTMAGLEVEHVDDPAAKLAAFSVAKVVEAVQHPNADRLRVCQVDTVDGRKEIVCGAPNARAGLTTIYAAIGTYIPGSGITLEPRPVRGVVSNGMLCSAAELQVGEGHDGIVELDDSLAVGASTAEALGLEAVIDFEVTPNRPDWLGVDGIARDLAAAGLGKLKDLSVAPVPGAFPCPIDIRLDGTDACPAFAGRLIRGVRNGPSPPWLQARLRAIGHRSISALVDVTNLITFDRARPLHVYDAAKLAGGFIEARLGKSGESLEALDGQTYEVTPDICVIADGSGAIGLGGVMGGASTGCSEATTDVFVESAYFDPIRTAQTGRTTAIVSDAQYRFARGVDPDFMVPGLELATRLILELCGGEASDVLVAGRPLGPPGPIAFDPAYVERLSGLDIPRERTLDILSALGFSVSGSKAPLTVQPPSWRRDVDGKADLVEEVARIAGYDALPATPLPELPSQSGGVLNARQARARAARRALAAAGYQEAVTWSFTARKLAALFGGGQAELVLANPIAAELDTMRPSILPTLIEAAARNARRGFADVALFEIGPVYAGDRPRDQRTAVTAILSPHAPRRWDAAHDDDLFSLKGDLMALMDELGAPASSMQVAQGQAGSWWHPGRSARLQLGPKTVLAEFGELHPAVLKALDIDGPVYGFEIWLEAIPEPKRRAIKTRPVLDLSPLMPLTRDFAFVVAETTAAGDLVRAVQSADKALITTARVFDVYQGQGVPAGQKSLAVEVTVQPRDHTLTDAEIEALSARILAAAEKAVGARLEELSAAMVIEPLAYTHGDVALKGVLGLPDDRSQKRPGVLVAHAADGISDEIERRVRLLADLGYVALAADLYGGVHPLAGPAVGEAMMALRADNDVLRGRIRAGLDALAARPEVDAARTAAIGYCFGGMAVLELARSGAPVLGVVSYHGLLTTLAPARPGEVTARVMVCTGARDPYAPRMDVDAFQDEMTDADVDWSLHVYGRAEHSFTTALSMAAVDMPGLRYDPSADRQSWAATLSFFEELFAA